MSVLKGGNGCGRWDEARFTKLLTQLAVVCAPRRFALCEVHGDRDDGTIAWWGMADAERAHIVSVDGLCTASFDSAEDALDRFSHIGEMRLVWIDGPREREE
ncbi:hypothetical protein [Streptoalloteichus hindustanus]|uniref:Uncharacterized protein n=1 Tax=Streptoalloteichus hindustanus TaxID=2017 RepID=A0A1M4TKT1_STRHI|nr:hypothetical protein [Streptoalloteichus hindustanus]SHE45006.1 hypothetical protein SAMN05444320_101117 [Streptoalloteichus hindustanus]